MDFLRSMFGAYADAAKLQAVIDASNARFNVPFWQRYFTLGTPQVSLSYVTVLGKNRIDAAASVVSRNARTPLRSRANIGKLQGEIPAIKVMKVLDEDDYRSYLTFQSLQIADATKKAQLLDLMFGDIKSVVNSVNKRIDYLVLEGISTGFVTITADNNPDGVVLDNLDLLAPDHNFLTVAKVWTDPTALIMTDIRNSMVAIKALYKQVANILVSDVLMNKIIANAEVKASIAGWNNPGSNNKFLVDFETINAYMTAQRYPTFVIIDEIIAIEKDGVNTNYRPFSDFNAIFVPAGSLGEIKSALAIEELQPVPQVSYSKSGQINVSKWFANEPFGEYTKAEWNAFPSFDQIDNMFFLQSNVVTV